MKLFEFEAKNVLQKYGTATPKGNIASNPDEAEVIAKEIDKPVVLKSQILVSGRGKAGLGQSTCVGLGGDAIVGLDFIKVLKMFKDDEETKCVILVGEIGGNAEELAAQYISETNCPKPVVAYIAGRLAPPGKRMGHAGAITMGSTGTAKSKIDAFTLAGVSIAEKPSDIVRLLTV